MNDETEPCWYCDTDTDVETINGERICFDCWVWHTMCESLPKRSPHEKAIR